MRILYLSAACAFLATNANAFDINNKANWALSGIMPVTHSLVEASEEDAVLVLPAHAFETHHSNTHHFESAPVVARSTETADTVAKRPGLDGIRKYQDQLLTRVSLVSTKTVSSYAVEANATGEMELLINDKWRTAEDFYVADFFKAHQ